MFPMDVPCHRRSRVPATLLALCCAWLPLSAVAADRPEDFAAQAALALEGEGPWYRLDVPMAVHLAAAHGDLRDLRIFDADGQTQAYHLGSGREQYRETRQETAVTRFPLYARRNSQDVPEVRIRRGEGGTLVEVAPPARQDPEAQQLRGWLLDGSAVQDSLQQLVLDWDEQEGEGFQQFSIEASDDLQHWRAWGTGQVARLAFADERILQAEVELPGLKARYLRLLWLEPKQAPNLRSATLISVRGDRQAAPLNWSEPLVAGRAGNGELIWELPMALPLERVRIEPIERGTLAPVRLSGRADASQPWRGLASGVLYHLPEQGVERLNDELTLPGQSVRQLSMRVDPRGGGLSGEPRLRVALPASQVIFLARGKPPYTLAVGNPRLQDQSLPLTTLRPGQTTGSTDFAVARVDGSVRFSSAGQQPDGVTAAAGIEAKRLGLWVVLLSGVGLLVMMSLKMLRKPAEEV